MTRLTAARYLRLLAILVAAHGIVFAIAAFAIARFDDRLSEALGDLYFFLVAGPALILAIPFSPLLWRLHLMQTTGWFAWPTPGGFLLVYFAWTLALLAVSVVLRSLKERGNAC